MKVGRVSLIFLFFLGSADCFSGGVAKADDAETIISIIPDNQKPTRCVVGVIGEALSHDPPACDDVQLNFCPSLGLRRGGVIDLKSGPPGWLYYRQIRCIIPPATTPAVVVQAAATGQPPRKCMTFGVPGANGALPDCATAASQLCSASRLSGGYIIDLNAEASANRSFRQVQCFQKP